MPAGRRAMAVGGDHFERDAAEAQKAHRIGRANKTVDERRLDLVEIGLRRCRGIPRLVRRLPLRHRRVGRVIVSGTAVAVMMVVAVAVTMIVIVAMIMRVAVLASPVHGGPQ